MSKESLAPASDLTDDERFGAYICDDETVKTIAQILEEKNMSSSLIKSGGIENAIRTLASMKSPQILVVDLSKSIDPNEDINALAEVCDAGTMVIAIGTQNDVNLYRDLISAGIQDYLIKPLKVDDFRETLLNTEHSLRAIEEEVTEEEVFDETDKIISVVGVKGGVGSSTIATSVAWLLANKFKRATALLDLDIYFGTDALTFDLEPGRGLIEALENPSRVDGLFIERAMIKESPNLSILSAEASLNDPTYTDPSALTHLLTELKSNFRYVVMDLPRNVMAEHPMLLSQSNEIILVSDLSLSATRDTIRMVAFCKNVVPNAKVTILINKYPGPALAEVSLKDFALSIEREVDWQIGLDQKLMLAVARDGKNLPASAKNSRMVKVIHAMTRKIIGYEDEKETSEPFWKKLINKKKPDQEKSGVKKRA